MGGQLNEVVDCLKDDEPLLDSVLVHMGSMYSLWESLRNQCLHIGGLLVTWRTYMVSSFDNLEPFR